MKLEISERAFEDAIECALLRNGPDAYPEDPTGVQEPVAEYGDDPLPGNFHKRQQTDYDRGLCLIPSDVLDFLLATQPKQWAKLKQHYGADVKPRFLGRLSREIARRGSARRPPKRRQGLGLQVPPRVLPPGERAQRGTPTPPRREPLRGHPPTPFQREERSEH